MLNELNESVFPLNQAPKHAEPLIGKRLGKSTFYRWAYQGVRGVKLETWILGGHRYTSLAALNRFFSGTANQDPVAKPSQSRVSEKRRKEIEKANRELEAAGF